MFDYIGGDVPNKIFNMMPADTSLYILANLTGACYSIETATQILFTNKSIQALLVYRWVMGLSQEEKHS